MLAGVLATGGVSTRLAGLSSGVMPLRPELLEIGRRAVRGPAGLGASRKSDGAAEMLGSAVRAVRVLCRPRQATRASFEAVERAMFKELLGLKRSANRRLGSLKSGIVYGALDGCFKTTPGKSKLRRFLTDDRLLGW